MTRIATKLMFQMSDMSNFFRVVAHRKDSFILNTDKISMINYDIGSGFYKISLENQVISFKLEDQDSAFIEFIYENLYKAPQNPRFNSDRAIKQIIVAMEDDVIIDEGSR